MEIKLNLGYKIILKQTNKSNLYFVFRNYYLFSHNVAANFKEEYNVQFTRSEEDERGKEKKRKGWNNNYNSLGYENNEMKGTKDCNICVTIN